MTKTTVLALPGTGHPNGGDGVTESFLACFDSDLYDVRIVPYAAAFGGTEMPFEESRQTGYKALVAVLTELNGKPVVLSGYSQGAVIAGDLAHDIAAGLGPAGVAVDIRAVALIADGYRPRGIGVVPAGDPNGVAEGYGIAGERPIPDHFFPTFWVSAWGDPIAALPAGNPLRTVADLVGWFSIRSPQDALNWGARMLDAVISGRMQDWWNPVKWPGWAGALAFARGYLFDGRHTDDYIIHGYTRALGAAVRAHLEG